MSGDCGAWGTTGQKGRSVAKLFVGAEKGHISTKADDFGKVFWDRWLRGFPYHLPLCPNWGTSALFDFWQSESDMNVLCESASGVSSDSEKSVGHKWAEVHLFPLTFPIEFPYREIYPKIVYLCPTCALSDFGLNRGRAHLPGHRRIVPIWGRNREPDHKVGGRGETRSGCHQERLRGIPVNGGVLSFDHRIAKHHGSVLSLQNTIDDRIYRFGGETGSERHHGRLRALWRQKGTVKTG